MENASKALIIAGAILLAILLISLGILIFNQAQDTVNNSGMSEAQKTTFNSKFQKYESSTASIPGSQVKALVNEVLACNSDEDAGNNVAIAGILTVKNTASKADTSVISTGKKYKVTLAYANGVVSKITIEE